MKTNTHFQTKKKESSSTAISLINPRSIKEIMEELDEPKRFCAEVILDALSVIKRHLKYRPPFGETCNVIADPKPLAEIRWFLTSPLGGKNLAEILGLSRWQSFYNELKPLLERAEIINPHLTSCDDEFYAAYEASQLIDNDSFDDVIIHGSPVTPPKVKQPAINPGSNLTFPFYDLYLDSGLGIDRNSQPVSRSVKKRLFPQNTLHRLQSTSDNFSNNPTNGSRTTHHTFVQTELFPNLISNSSKARRSK